MDPKAKKYLAFEAFMSALFNAVLNFAAAFLVFHRGSAIPLSGKGGMIQDSAGETFFVVILTVGICLLIQRHRRHKGHLPPTGKAGPAKKTGNPYLRALAAAVLFTIVLGCMNAWLLPRVLPPSVTFTTELIFKTVYGAALGAFVSALAVYRSLHEQETARSPARA